MPDKYIVTLTPEEHCELVQLSRRGELSARKMKRPQILILADKGHQDETIAEMLSAGVSTVHRTRQKFVEGGLEFALKELPRPGGTKKLDSKAEAFLVATACSEPPAGFSRWTMQLLAERLVELKVVESLSDETVRRSLGKKQLKPWLKEQWCFSSIGADFVWRMEDILDLYAQAYDPDEPVVCFDERPCQLIGETRVPCPPKPGRPERYDYEYERKGTCNVFGFFQPLQSKRHLKVTEHRTSEDFALCMQYLVDVLFPDAQKLHVVLDNLNTHTPAALYKTFKPEEALRILNHIQFHYTPKHGSWLNMVEFEFSALSRQCLNRRIPEIDQLRQEVAAWEHRRNLNKTTVNWLFTVDDARTKLTKLYPQPRLS
ncbi:MAG: IS630 family transposase [Leptolyngbyaceae cyanobacterium SU_3_3]|nr:IS630 family transposase [Leptolyngbyaceae cyanobacterium SU_3_3]